MLVKQEETNHFGMVIPWHLSKMVNHRGFLMNSFYPNEFTWISAFSLWKTEPWSWLLGGPPHELSWAWSCSDLFFLPAQAAKIAKRLRILRCKGWMWGCRDLYEVCFCIPEGEIGKSIPNGSVYKCMIMYVCIYIYNINQMGRMGSFETKKDWVVSWVCKTVSSTHWSCHEICEFLLAYART